MTDTPSHPGLPRLNLLAPSPQNIPSWVWEALGLKRDLNGGRSCSKDLQVLYSSESDSYLLVPTFCRRRTCPHCAAAQGRERISRMLAALDALNLPTHVILTVPNRGCRAGALALWLRRLTQARRSFLRRGQRHRALGTMPVLDWYLWKIEVTWSDRHAWWHPHIHILCDGWIQRPTPPVLIRENTRRTRATLADFWRFRWADCLRHAGLPTPRYPHSWAPGDKAPAALQPLIKIVSWDPDTEHSTPLLNELAKYVTKPQVLESFSDARFDEYRHALEANPGRLRTWQPRRGWLTPQDKGSGDWKFIGTLGRMMNPGSTPNDPGLYYLGIEIRDKLRDELTRPPHPTPNP